MCGITGFIDNCINYDAKSVALNMSKSILHRGPDDAGLWQDDNLGINLMHRRLSILDLSAAGHQPMVSKSGRYVIVFNGEIYNYKKIAKELEVIHGQINWNWHSDTEVILMAMETYGFSKTLQLLEGMFAFALWDREEQQLFLARDRIGEKPLYYGYLGNTFVFASELKAMKQHPKFNFDINRNALGQFMLHNCIPGPLSIFKDIYKLQPGTYLCLEYKDFLKRNLPQNIAYWKLSDHLNQVYLGDELSAVNDLENLLQNVIAEQMIADVPVGCFLSGGVDSSTIAAIMQKVSTKPIQTFTIGFDNPNYNEANFAKEVAKHLKTEHNELYVTERDALDVIPKLPGICDEPFADSSQVPTYLVSQFAKQKVTVSLSGDAGDELFGGYSRYLLADDLYTKFSKLPRILKFMLVYGIKAIPVSLINKIGLRMKFQLTNLNDKLYKLDYLLNSNNFEEFYLSLTSHWKDFDDLVIGNKQTESLWGNFKAINFNQNRVRGMQYLDTLGYLPDDILVKVDRAAMANSLETRVPFLNHRVVEFAYSLPEKYKINNGVSKYILRQVLYKYVPKELIERPKRGFAVPLNDWLRGSLRDWAEDLLTPSKLNNQGYLRSELIQKKWAEHLSGKANNGFYLWDVLMFQQWLEAWHQ